MAIDFRDIRVDTIRVGGAWSVKVTQISTGLFVERTEQHSDFYTLRRNLIMELSEKACAHILSVPTTKGEQP